MNRLHRQPICVASALLVPLCVLASPPWLMISGVGPAWGVLWLLPWALVDGPVSGVVAGLSLGLVLDGLSLDPGTQIPCRCYGVVVGAWAAVQRFSTVNWVCWLRWCRCARPGHAAADLGSTGVVGGLRSWGVQTLSSVGPALMAPLLVLSLLLWRRRPRIATFHDASSAGSLAMARRPAGGRLRSRRVGAVDPQLAPKFNDYFADLLASWRRQQPSSVVWTDLPWGSVERKLLAAVFETLRIWSISTHRLRPIWPARAGWLILSRFFPPVPLICTFRPCGRPAVIRRPEGLPFPGISPSG